MRGGGALQGGGRAAPAKLRPTMISAKYRLKEERRKVLKISVAKLRKIEDPESSLRRSVLINNTMRRLQREAREEKLLKQFPHHAPTPAPTPPSPAPVTRKRRCYDEADDSDVQDVLSQFYMPPTPRLLTSIDDDPSASGAAPLEEQQDEEERPQQQEEVRMECERPPAPPPPPAPSPSPPLPKRARPSPSASSASSSAASTATALALHAAGLSTRVAAHGPEQFSCGHSSLFGEIQAAVYHSLIASLES